MVDNLAVEVAGNGIEVGNQVEGDRDELSNQAELCNQTEAG